MREHVVQLNENQTRELREWLVRPNGAHCPTKRVCVEAVESGGVLIRTKPYGWPNDDSARDLLKAVVNSDMAQREESEGEHSQLLERIRKYLNPS